MGENIPSSGQWAQVWLTDEGQALLLPLMKKPKNNFTEKTSMSSICIKTEKSINKNYKMFVMRIKSRVPQRTRTDVT